MRIVLLIVITALLASCNASNFSKRKFTSGKFKTKSEKYKVVKTNDDSQEENIVFLEKTGESNPITVNEILPIEMKEDNASVSKSLDEVAPEDEETHLVTDLKSLDHLYSYESEIPLHVQDTVIVGDFEKAQAQNAERQGRVSFILSLCGIAGIFLGVIPGVALFITSIVFGAKSLRSRFNTLRGVDQAKFGVIFSSIMLVLALLALGFFLFAIFIFGF